MAMSPPGGVQSIAVEQLQGSMLQLSGNYDETAG
jgi:hypothetical protein